MSDPAVFLDRDGTLNEDVHYLSRPDQFVLLPGVPEALALLRDLGFALVVVSNQSGLARGFFTPDDLEAIHAEMRGQLGLFGIQLAGVYCCPHLPDAAVAEYRLACDCRKPAPGLFLRAAKELSLDLGASWAIGDRDRDCLAGEAAGSRPILLGGEPHPRFPTRPDLLSAARAIRDGVYSSSGTNRRRSS